MDLNGKALQDKLDLETSLAILKLHHLKITKEKHYFSKINLHEQQMNTHKQNQRTSLSLTLHEEAAT